MSGFMPKLKSALLPGLLLGFSLMPLPMARAADTVPAFDVIPSCKAATQASVVANRDESACKRDEDTAKSKLEQDWSQFTPAQKNHCVQLSTLGGPASYVELATCLELSKAAKDLPRDMLSSTKIGQ